MIRNTLFAFLTLVPSLCAQTDHKISFGVIGGADLISRSNVPSIRLDESRPYLIGASFEIRLMGAFALETDAIYKRVGRSQSYSFLSPPVGSSSSFSSRERGNSWEFPVLGKYYFRAGSPGWHPFVASGFAVQTTWLNTRGTSILSGTNGGTYSFDAHSRTPLAVGAIVAVGMQAKAGPVAFAPQIRYTRWGDPGNNMPKNRVSPMLGISF